MKKKILTLFTCFLTFIVGIHYFTLKQSVKPNVNKKIKNIVSTYYDNISKEKYDSALQLFNYSSSDYINDLKQIKKLKKQYEYKINYPPDNMGWIQNITYDAKKRIYIVEANANIKYINKEWTASELVFVKKLKGKFKIIKILTDDRYCSFRGSKVLYIGKGNGY
ncbi:hypothetical protein CLTEP_05740 [Clostridium tepidiprofundi DSM 19306]|uniref:DUF4829 domain-containing protein n=1 Tax=Clostridium tepidiprofundi DSM 19306 TaxID=1121338 RepID=A0A151B644_9CLOT|nr:hypothetical protein [Clostridium tepidiprofundi]KYH35398.1 hypothetical protein CLTEP_05740 [Clostridium tepidiprofundi DSM 19306]